MQTMPENRLDEPADRVRAHTAPTVNRQLDRLTQANIDASIRGGRDAVIRRIAELDHEWDIDRAMMANFAIAGGSVLAVGIVRYTRKPFLQPRRKGLLYFFGAQLGFLLLHAVAGWCPPASLFRRLGFRTKAEIENEKSILVRASSNPEAT
ncbi:DUF2892 domain-containing protein [Pendulispora rubella]|uniref:DUF2892 domain-containing protein n=1 Tax=Pendulispora rubella TaxID=2741070 RepID=A0ABZ2L710_9BACT